MAEFGIRFFLCNILICVATGILLAVKYALRRHLTSRAQFSLWFPLLAVLAFPFLPFLPARLPQMPLWLDQLTSAVSPNLPAAAGKTAAGTSAAAEQIYDFALSVSGKTPAAIGLALFWIWLCGVLALLFGSVQSAFRFHALKKSALPLQNNHVRLLYRNCLRELHIKRNLPIYSTAFLKSPMITGLCRPCIYLPIHLLSDLHTNTQASHFHTTDLRYMLLHELQHYKRKDALTGCLIHLAGILYWYNPLLRYARNEMRSDREIACDASVLELLDEKEYEAYGHTLLNFAEKISHASFPFSAGISSTKKQMRKRILHISSYQKPSVRQKIKGCAVWSLLAIVLIGLSPMLSAYAAPPRHYHWNTTEQVTLLTVDASPAVHAHFNKYEGSFVLYDYKNGIWRIYDPDQATLRTSPDSTYKIYDALFGLEEHIITADQSFMAWNQTSYPIEAWNADQDLYSAMRYSVNWYFQEIDRQLGLSAIRRYIRKIGYGNTCIPANRTSYWMQSALKISPVEQVLLLRDLYDNRFAFSLENIDAVKNSICLFSSKDRRFYGKTGTGRVDGRDVNGWFIGYIEVFDDPYFFATHIQSSSNANGSKAAEITKAVLADLDLWP